MSPTLKYALLAVLLAAGIATFRPDVFYRSPTPTTTPTATSTPGPTAKPSPKPDVAAPEKVFSAEELANFKGDDDGPIYLAVMGLVYDVTKGRDFYGPGGGYAFFTGIDGSRAFVTGDFTPEGLIDDVTDLKNEDYLGLLQWSEFYAKDYKIAGKLKGRYFDDAGNPTEYWHQAQQWIAQASGAKEEEEAFKAKYPMCNVDYKPSEGSRVWCSKASGGVQRDWVGVPRSLHSADSSKIRCACVPADQLDDPMLRPYPNCEPDAESCKLSD